MAIERWVFRKANGLVFVSGIFRDRALAAHGQMAPTIVTHNAANIDKFSFTDEQRNAARAQWKLDGHVVCGYLGAFVPWHAIDQFVHRIADHLPQAPHLKLLLVGDGPDRPRVEALAVQLGLQNRVIYSGQVPTAEPYYSIADIAVLNSRTEGSPNALLEAMAAGTPVERTAALAAERGYTVYLLGAAEGVAAETAAVLRRRHPALQVVGVHAGSPHPSHDLDIIQRVRAAATAGRPVRLLYAHARHEWMLQQCGWLEAYDDWSPTGGHAAETITFWRSIGARAPGGTLHP